MEKLDLTTPDLTASNVERIAELFPNVVTESRDAQGKVIRAVDFDLLRQELSDEVVEGPTERYRLDWPGKRAAAFAANAPINKTLRPVRDDSVDFDTTQNLFIEGDNLDALKLLQESYLGKVKLIYIDPPYNTGHDFIYKDNFAQTSAEYLEASGQTDDEGNRLVANTDSNGRFHSDWLSMMYPRLKLARNLLSEDGVIFVSIDEAEVAALKLAFDEVFGADMFVEQIAWKNKYNAGALARGVSNVHEYILMYSRTRLASVSAPMDEEQRSQYKLRDEKFAVRGGYVTQPLATRTKDPRPNLVYPIDWNGREVRPNKQWIWSKERMQRALGNDEIVFSEKNGNISVRGKQYLRNEDGKERLGKPVSVLIGPYNQAGSRDFENLFGGKVFDYPKPVDLIAYLVSFVINDEESKDGVVLDFFAGSGTTAHAVMAQNAADGGNRRFIMVQLDEATDEKSAARAAGYKTIAELSRERIRRAGQKIKDEAGLAGANLDVGFRALRIDSTNMADVLRTPDDTAQPELDQFEGSVKADRTGEDLVFQVLFDWGLELSMPIEVEQLDGFEVFTVEDGALIACFDNSITTDLARAIAKRQPLRAVFKDSGFASDDARINVEQIFKELSPDTDVRVI